jgi:alkylhydroperoxidase family enzyme
MVLTKCVLVCFSISAGLLPAAAAAFPPASGSGLATPLSNADAWKKLPRAERGGEQPLPSWARMMAGELPRTTAALLQLDFAQRTKGPVSPKLRAAMRWIAAHANRCTYSEAYAAADARRAGLDESRIEALANPNYPGWTDSEQAALDFALKMTLHSDLVTDLEFAILVKAFGEKQAASMVLLLANANFQDRLLLCLGAAVEPGGPFPPADISFEPSSFTTRTTPPIPRKATLPKPTGKDLVEDDSQWAGTSYDALQSLLEAQRQKPTRLPIPSWDEAARNVPEGMMKKPNDIVWYRVVFGYAPELAVPFETYMRTSGAEAAPKYDRIFAGSIFWVVTRAINCPYCMGHCEMTWEVAGLTKPEIAERSRLLAGDDWSSFPPKEQRAFAFARRLTTAPWSVSGHDIEELKTDFGADRALIIALNASRYNYMTRISNGFQLKLERDNVFFDYFNTKRPAPGAVAGGSAGACT